MPNKLKIRWHEVATDVAGVPKVVGVGILEDTREKVWVEVTTMSAWMWIHTPSGNRCRTDEGFQTYYSHTQKYSLPRDRELIQSMVAGWITRHRSRKDMMPAQRVDELCGCQESHYPRYATFEELIKKNGVSESNDITVYFKEENEETPERRRGCHPV